MVYTKAELSLIPYINFQNRQNTGVDALFTLTTKRIELLIGQKITKQVVNITS